MVLVGKIERLRQAAGAAVNIRLGYVEDVGRRREGGEVVALGMSLCAVELGGALGKAKYLGLEEMVIGGGSFLVMLGTSGMKLQCSLKTLEGLVDVEFAGGVNLFVGVLFGLKIDG